jgi:hypothetical protein
MPHTQDPPVTDSPVYWFVILDQALSRGNWPEAERAKRELARLGIDVAHKAPGKEREVHHVK